MSPRWVVGIDGSDAASAALRWAVAHATGRDVGLTALGAYHVPVVMSAFVAKRGFGVDELGLAATAGHDVDVAIAAAGDPSVAAVVAEGQPQQVLVDAAADADLLVLGRTGRGDLRHQLLGSVSHYCVTHAPAPVAVVPPGGSGRTASTIAVGFDGSEHSATALRWALDFAGAADAVSVQAIGAIEVAPWFDIGVDRERFGGEIDREEQRLIAALDAIDPEGRVQRSIRLSAPKEALAEAQATADLMVVGSRGHGRVAAGLLGSVSSWLLHHATLPVVVVPGP